jgi:hypothetical protein
MDAVTIAEWFQRQKYNVIHTKSSFWLEVQPHIVQSFPYHWLINPEHDEMDALWHNYNIYGARYSSPLASTSGKLSYHVVFPLDSENFTLEGVRKKPRYDIRKGLKNFEIGPISFDRLKRDGWQVRKETLNRQNRSGAESKQWWEKMCSSADGLPGFEAWAAYCEGVMAASALVVQCEDHYYIYYQQSRTDSLRFGVNNALAYAITSDSLNKPGVRKVFYGLQSLDARPSVDRFKFRMGFEAKPVRQIVLFHPYVAPLVNPISHSVLSTLGKMKPGSALTKAEGMFRFYLEGRKKISDQEWPEILRTKSNGFYQYLTLESVINGDT